MTGIIILAAGSSSRLGKPKQNIVYQDKTLLQKTIETALAVAGNPVIVVLGANSHVIKPTIEHLPITIVYNEDWQQGMASSIRSGLNELRNTSPDKSAVLLMLCDQPFADIELINLLITNHQENGITASAYNDTTRPPAIFDKYYFDELLKLKGSEGAKKLLLKYADTVNTIPFPLGSIDIDTLKDVDELNKKAL
ncbi:nucleotidyltransferase family protein [Mucilaginibacter sp.]|uniref:nucleotidyltransferase family protein n=1 Tax=Mucilaginibacter sp. TaxID=1882438 RepID=UPI003D0A2A0E